VTAQKDEWCLSKKCPYPRREHINMIRYIAIDDTDLIMWMDSDRAE